MFQVARGGTIFLDEVAEMSPPLQVKLLRVLQEREFRPVGSDRSMKTDVRVIAATNKELFDEVSKGRFREDLFYRHQVMPIHLPSLRERKGDVLVLAAYFIDRFNREFRKRVKGLSPAAAETLMAYPWPGNVRELENAMERAVALARSDRIDLEDLPPEVSAAPPAGQIIGDIRTLAAVERDYIAAALRASGGNRAKAAEQLGIGVATLYRKLKQDEASE